MSLQKVRVVLKPAIRSYDVLIGHGALALCAKQLATLAPRGVIPVITDQVVADLHLKSLEKVLSTIGVKTPTLILPPGEATKSFAHLESVCSFLLELGMERDDCLLAFGGGVVGDLAGLASALVKRGTNFVQIPTTLLAQVDSSVGGKTAINTSVGKNMVGVFHQPKLVIVDLDLLQTLDPRQWRAGYAEILKLACLADAKFFDYLETFGPDLLTDKSVDLGQTIARAVRGKAKIVAEDEFEAGRRALLNLGHSFAHALESEAPGNILHGEAVAAGIGAAFAFSAENKYCSTKDRDRVLAHLTAMNLPSTLAEAPGGPYKASKLLSRIQSDKKNRQGQIHLVLCHTIGDAFITNDIPELELLAFMENNLR